MALEFVAGCVGGCAGVAVGHPFDTIKVRLQTQDSFNPRYRGTWHCFTHTLKAESVRGLYRGMSSPLAGVSALNAVIFGVHGNIMKHVEDPKSLRSQAAAGGAAGFVQAFIASPMELAKTRMQIQPNLGQGVPPLYNSPLHCLRTIFRTEGLRGIFRGQVITVLREIPGFASCFASYEYLLRTLTPKDESPSAAATLAAGGLSGSLSWVVTYPLDVVKSRIQADGMDGENKYRGIWHCFRTSVGTEGMSVMTRGLTSTIIRAFPTNAATFTVVSWVMKLGDDLEQPAVDPAAWLEVLARGEILITAAATPLFQTISPTLDKHMKHWSELQRMIQRMPVLTFHHLAAEGKD